MKLKPIYLYISLLIVALVTLISISSDTEESEITSTDNNTTTNETMMKPSSNNVNSKLMEQMKELEEYVTNNPSDTAKVKEYAAILYAAHNEDKAMEYFEKILDVSDDRTDILKILAMNDFNKGEYNSARTRIAKILSLEPDNPETIYNMGVIESKIGNIEAARIQWENLLKFHPNSKMSEKAKQSLANIDK